ncbi:MAG: hypothetical protein Q9207_006114 [Kuettlingeria erythrocarpa]
MKEKKYNLAFALTVLSSAVSNSDKTIRKLLVKCETGRVPAPMKDLRLRIRRIPGSNPK